MQLHSPSPEATRALARVLAAAIDARGLVIVLSGPLGAGKTVFAKGLAEGSGVDPAGVASPSFSIAHEHTAPGGRRFAHVDLFRVESPGELEATGFLDLLEPGAVVAIEWGERLAECLPADRLEIRIERPDPERAATARVLNAVGLGPVARASAARWRELLARSGGGHDRWR